MTMSKPLSIVLEVVALALVVSGLFKMGYMIPIDVSGGILNLLVAAAILGIVKLSN